MIHTRVSVELTSIFINSISGYVQKCHTYFRSIHCNIKHINTKDFLILQKLFLYRQLKRRPSFLNASHNKYKLLYDFIYLYFYAATTATTQKLYHSFHVYDVVLVQLAVQLFRGITYYIPQQKKLNQYWNTDNHML